MKILEPEKEKKMRLREILGEMKLEMLYFLFGLALAIASPFTGQFSIAFFWTGMALLSLGWIAIGIKIRALIHLKRVEVLREAIREDVERSIKREVEGAGENSGDRG